MNCPECNYAKPRMTHVRKFADYNWRRFRCKCGKTFTTYERLIIEETTNKLIELENRIINIEQKLAEKVALKIAHK